MLLDPNRRQFLKKTGAALAATPQAGAGGARYTIDCQSHLFVPEVVRIMEQRTTPPRIFRNGDGPDGVKIARIIHDYLAQVVKRHPSRFIGLATLALQDMENLSAVDEEKIFAGNAKRLFRL